MSISVMASSGHGDADDNNSSEPAIHALSQFFATSCLSYEPARDAVNAPSPALSLASPRIPQINTESAHEHAFGFLFADEMRVVRNLQTQRDLGRELFMKVYCARSCAAAIPPMPTADANPTRMHAYYSAVSQILQPQMDKLLRLCDYCTQTVVILSDTIQRIAAQENTHRVIPDVLLDGIVDVMDVVLQMNQLHDAKSGFRNDFSLYKRVFQNINHDLAASDPMTKEIQRLQEFVGNSGQTKGSIWDSLRHNLTSVKRFDRVISLLIKHCLGWLEDNRCVLPSDRFKFVRVLPCLMAVLDGNFALGRASTLSGTDRKLVDTAIKYVARFPVVPIFADVCVQPLSPFISSCNTKLDRSSLTSDAQRCDPLFNLVETLSKLRAACNDFLPRALLAMTKMEDHKGVASDALKASTNAFDAISEGIRHISEWKASILLFLAMKYQSPKSDTELKQMGARVDSPFIEYERVVKHNFEAEECAALIDSIHAVKSVVQALQAHRMSIISIVRNHVYQHLQRFVQHTLVPIMHRAEKRKHASLKMLQEVRSVCGDWIDSNCPIHDYRRRRRERQLPDILSRKSGTPTQSQLQMLRTIIHSIFAKQTTGEPDAKSGFFSFQREMKSSDLHALETFYKESADFELLLNVNDILGELGSFGELWFRELHLEIVKAPQIPIESGMCWMLLKYIFSCDSCVSVRSAFSILDVYNDSARMTLCQVRQYSIYEEVEAEARLFFDHLVYLFADHVFSSTKSKFAQLLLGNACMEKLNMSLRTTPMHRHAVTHTRAQDYDACINANRRIAVVGETCDLMVLVSGHVAARFTRDLGATLARMNGADITLVVSTQNLLNILRSTHTTLSAFLQLDGFDDMWDEVNDHANEERVLFGVSVGLWSRVQRAIAVNLRHDLFRNFGFNSRTGRFFRTPLAAELRQHLSRPNVVEADCLDHSRDVGTLSARKALESIGLERTCRLGFEVIHRAYRNFVGTPHVEALVSLLTQAELVSIVEDTADFISTQIFDVLDLCIPVIGSTIPPYRFPKLLYRTEGCFGYFESKFQHMMEPAEVEAQVFHCLRCIGNALMLVRCISQVADARQSPPTGNLPTGSSPLFRNTLERLHGLLHADSEIAQRWHASENSSPEKNDNSASFFLVWNALEFRSCCPHADGNITNRELYGEGVYVAGCTITHLLHQRSLYEMWNPSQYVLDVHDHDRAIEAGNAATTRAIKGRRSSFSSRVNSPTKEAYAVGTLDAQMLASTRVFLVQAAQMRRSSKHMFHLLETTWTPGPIPVHQSTFKAPVFCPPESQTVGTKQML